MNRIYIVFNGYDSEPIAVFYSEESLSKMLRKVLDEDETIEGMTVEEYVNGGKGEFIYDKLRDANFYLEWERD